VTLVGVHEHTTDQGWDWRQCQGSGNDRELKMIHDLGDPGNTTGDHRVGAVGVMSHINRVVD
jgi:hypothetical protein